MALAVCLLFDARSYRRVRKLWSRLEEAGVPTVATHTHRRHDPHLSYAVLRSWDLLRVQEALSAGRRAVLHVVPRNARLPTWPGRACALR